VHKDRGPKIKAEAFFGSWVPAKGLGERCKHPSCVRAQASNAFGAQQSAENARSEH